MGSRLSEAETKMIYQIKVQGELDQSWSDWLGEVEITAEQAEDGSVITTLMVDAADQPALFGVLDRIRDLNFILIQVSRVGEGGDAILDLSG
jgi:hypothetical protein